MFIQGDFESIGGKDTKALYLNYSDSGAYNYFLMKDGELIKKWNYSDTFDYEDENISFNSHLASGNPVRTFTLKQNGLQVVPSIVAKNAGDTCVKSPSQFGEPLYVYVMGNK